MHQILTGAFFHSTVKSHIKLLYCKKDRLIYRQNKKALTLLA